MIWAAAMVAWARTQRVDHRTELVGEQFQRPREVGDGVGVVDELFGGYRPGGGVGEVGFTPTARAITAHDAPLPFVERM